MTRTSYAYRAARPDGSLELGTVAAAGRDAAAAALSGRGLFPIEIRVGATAEARRARLPASDLALGLRVLATLLEAGLPMARALAAFGDLAPPSWQPALPSVGAAVREGQGLAAALAAAPLDVPPVVVGMIRAGEAGSGVAPAVRRAAELTERAAATQAAVRGALAYPLILGLTGAASLALLVGVVLPRFAVILADLGQALPASTRLVLAGAATLRAAALPGLAALGAAAVLWRAWTNTPAGRAQWHAMLLALPLVGATRRSAATARAAAALASLLESGVPVAAGLLHAALASGDAALSARLLAAREAVVTGGRIAAAVDAADAMTPTAVRLIRAGEESGRLAAMLTHAAVLEAERAEGLVKGAVRLLEPALILVFGALVALVAASLLQAIYSVRPAA